MVENAGHQPPSSATPAEGQRWTESFLHRIRGDILLKADPENSARTAGSRPPCAGVLSLDVGDAQVQRAHDPRDDDINVLRD